MKLKDLAAVCVDGQSLIIMVEKDEKIVSKHFATKGRRLEGVLKDLGNLSVALIGATSERTLRIIVR